MNLKKSHLNSKILAVFILKALLNISIVTNTERILHDCEDKELCDFVVHGVRFHANLSHDVASSTKLSLSVAIVGSLESSVKAGCKPWLKL